MVVEELAKPFNRDAGVGRRTTTAQKLIDGVPEPTRVGAGSVNLATPEARTLPLTKLTV